MHPALSLSPHPLWESFFLASCGDNSCLSITAWHIEHCQGIGNVLLLAKKKKKSRLLLQPLWICKSGRYWSFAYLCQGSVITGVETVGWTRNCIDGVWMRAVHKPAVDSDSDLMSNGKWMVVVEILGSSSNETKELRLCRQLSCNTTTRYRNLCQCVILYSICLFSMAVKPQSHNKIMPPPPHTPSSKPSHIQYLSPFLHTTG